MTIRIGDEDLRGVFGHKCDQSKCPVCHPEEDLVELAELYERAATPKRTDAECKTCGVKESEHSLASELHQFQASELGSQAEH